MKRIILAFAFSFLFMLSGYASALLSEDSKTQSTQATGKIFLYGETHAVEKILKKELELWGDFYQKQGFRHLFLELPFYTAQLLNIWMKAEGDEILDGIYNDWKGSASHHPAVRDFYIQIKKQFSETVFHGTDVGHQYKTTGKRYLDYLSKHNMEETEQYRLAKESIEQGESYYKRKDAIYREKMMTENFVREFGSLKGENIMGIYGSAHTEIRFLDRSKAVPTMANELYKRYGAQLTTVNLAGLAKDIDPLRIDNLQINGEEYKASYFGRRSLKGFKDFEYRDFWRLEDAYNNFKQAKLSGDKLPYNNYPMNIETGQVFLIEFKKTNGEIIQKYYRSDGNKWRNRPTTEEFVVD